MFKREDKRKFDQLRLIKIERNLLKYAEGSCLIEAGNTKLVISATVEDKVPSFLRDTKQGWLTAEYGMIPRSSKERIVRPTMRVAGRSLEIQRMIGRALRAGIDLDAIGSRTIIIDCDVIQADGGTRTLAISGAFCALYDAVNSLFKKRIIGVNPIKNVIAAISVGMLGNDLILDLTYEEDFRADVDMNVCMTDRFELVEIQGTAEGRPLPKEKLNEMIELAQKGISEIIEIQKETLGITTIF